MNTQEFHDNIQYEKIVADSLTIRKCFNCSKEGDDLRIIDEFPEHKWEGKLICRECIFNHV